MKNLKYYIIKAQKEHWAIGQFNFSTFEQAKGIVAAAEKLKAPVILGTSEGESKFVGLREAVAMRDVLRKKALRLGSGQAGLPIFLNLDHGKSFEYLKKAIVAGYDMVHFDGSKLPLEDNIKISKQVAKYAKWIRLRQPARAWRAGGGFGGQGGVVVEGEVGRFGTDASRIYEEKFEIKEEDLTNPSDAEKYVKMTGVDILAVSIGTFHGINITGVSPNLRLERLEEINVALRLAQGKTKPIGLVLHGGSGTPENDIREAIKLGIVKININTEIRAAFSAALRKFLENNKEEITPYKYLPDAVDAARKIAEEKIHLFGSQNKA